MSIDINTLPFSHNIANLMFEAKKNELSQVANKYEISFGELKSVLNEKLFESRAKVGTCNLATSFLIIETLDRNKKYNSIELAIAENILSAAIYYANVINRPECV